MRPVLMAAVGLAHPHILDQVRALVAAGATLAAWHPQASDTPALVQALTQAYPGARRVADLQALLDDPTIALITCAGVPAERAGLALQAMRHGKHVLVDKPGATSLAQLAALRRAQAETGRIWSVWFSERLAVRACTRASALVASGAIGRVLQTIGLGPHRLGAQRRADWFYRRAATGGILCDIGAHQVEQFLHYTGSTTATVLAAQACNLAHPDDPGLQDFGDATLLGNNGSGYCRVDWFTAEGLPTWGDGRLFILGTEGQIELRKTVDLAGRPGGEHLFLVDRQGTRHIDCSADPLPFGPALLQDLHDGGERAMAQAHTFLATELALRAQQLAETPAGAAIGATHPPAAT